MRGHRHSAHHRRSRGSEEGRRERRKDGEGRGKSDAEKRKLKKLRKEAKKFIKHRKEELQRVKREVLPDIESGALPRLSVKTHYFSHNSEFRRWLAEEEGLGADDLATEEARDLFRDFAHKWNRAKLPMDYYRPVSSDAPAAAARTTHKWNISVGDEEQDSIDRARRLHERGGSPIRGGRMAPNPPPIMERSHSDADVMAGPAAPSDTLKREDERARLKSERKQFNKHHNMVLDELAPRPASAHEARLEKRRQKGAYARKEEMSPERDDSFLMGSGGSDFQSMVARQVGRHEQRRLDREEELRRKQEEHRAAEEDKMAAFRAMAAQGNFPLLQGRR